MAHLCNSLPKVFASVAFIVLAAACGGDRKHADILSEAEMVRVLTQIYIDEEKIAKLNLRRDSADKIFKLAQPLILKKAGVTDSVFRESFNYYVDRPKQLELIFTAVVDSLNLKEQKLSVAPPTIQ